MSVFIISFVAMLLVVVAMAIGVILHNKELKGSCGGISSLGMEKVCDCDEPCDKRKARMAKARGEELDIKVSHD